jgi:excisionase family DNA binding protein
MIWESEQASGERMEVAAEACKDVASASAPSASRSLRLQALPEARLAYTVNEVRAFLGIGETLIYHLVAQDKIRHVKAGRRILIPKAALDEFLAGDLWQLR